MRELNEKVARIARVVVHPKYRTIGAGVKLVRESLPLCGKPYVEMIAVMSKYNPFAERAGMKKICESRIGQKVLNVVAALEKLEWIPFMLAVPEYNKRMLEGKVDRVKSILTKFSFPYSRRIAGQHTHFTTKDYKKWLKEASINHLSLALRRLAQLNQTKVYVFWKNTT